jgi:tRNA pseudouridine38/39 synthase
MDKSKGIQTFDRVIRDVKIEPASQVFGADDLGTLPHLYTFSLTGSAFLWHQVRCIMSILFMVGKGQEKPSIVSDMLDIQKYPAKPVYELAPDHPLVLWDCTYPEGSFKLVNDEVSFEMAVDALKSRWTEETIKMSVVRSLFSDIIPKDIEKTILVEAECKRKLERPHLPLEKRATCPPADMEHMQKYENKKIEKLKRKWGSAAVDPDTDF